MAVLDLACKLTISHLGGMNRWKCTQNMDLYTHRETEAQSLSLPGDVNIWQWRSISGKHVESVCWTEGISVGSQPAMWRCDSLMKNTCTCAWVCMCVPEQSCFHSPCRACYNLRKQSYLCGGEHCKGPIKCAGHHSRQPNICDLCIKQTREASGEQVGKLHSLPLSPQSGERWTLL